MKLVLGILSLSIIMFFFYEIFAIKTIDDDVLIGGISASNFSPALATIVSTIWLQEIFSDSMRLVVIIFSDVIMFLYFLDRVVNGSDQRSEFNLNSIRLNYHTEQV